MIYLIPHVCTLWAYEIKLSCDAAWHEGILSASKQGILLASEHKFNRNYTYMEDGSLMGLSFTIPKTYATTCKHTAFVCMRHEISYTIHDIYIYNTHHMTYNT